MKKKNLWIKLLGSTFALCLVSSLVGGLLVTTELRIRKKDLLGQFCKFFAMLVERSGDPRDRDDLEWMARAVARFDLPGADMWLVGPNGTVLSRLGGKPLPFEWKDIRPPRTPSEVAPFSLIRPRFPGALRFFGALQYFLGLRVFDPKPIYVIRLDRPEERYLVLRGKATGAFAIVLGWIRLLNIICLFLYALMSTVFILLYFRHKARIARDVVERLASGKLEARFKISAFDEVGQLMHSFNLMADRIEDLVRKVQHADQTRTRLIQEISHDLRTPLTSCIAAISALQDPNGKLSAREAEECLSVLGKELFYLHGIIEDLFFLAEIEEPGYRHEQRPIELNQLLTEMVNGQNLGIMGEEAALSWEFTPAPADLWIRGDRGLLTRMIRNALDNARKHAQNRIQIELGLLSDEKASIVIRDDGPGASEEAIRSFGDARQGRIRSGIFASGSSIGLGSVVMRSVAELHLAEVSLSCWKIPNTPATGGAELRFTFPLLQAEPVRTPEAA